MVQADRLGAPTPTRTDRHTCPRPASVMRLATVVYGITRDTTMDTNVRRIYQHILGDSCRWMPCLPVLAPDWNVGRADVANLSSFSCAPPPACLLGVRVRGNIIGHARTKYVCKFQPYMVISKWPINSPRIVRRLPRCD